ELPALARAGLNVPGECERPAEHEPCVLDVALADGVSNRAARDDDFAFGDRRNDIDFESRPFAEFGEQFRIAGLAMPETKISSDEHCLCAHRVHEEPLSEFFGAELRQFGIES